MLRWRGPSNNPICVDPYDQLPVSILQVGPHPRSRLAHVHGPSWPRPWEHFKALGSIWGGHVSPGGRRPTKWGSGGEALSNLGLYEPYHAYPLKGGEAIGKRQKLRDRDRSSHM